MVHGRTEPQHAVTRSNYAAPRDAPTWRACQPLVAPFAVETQTNYKVSQKLSMPMQAKNPFEPKPFRRSVPTSAPGLLSVPKRSDSSSHPPTPLPPAVAYNFW